MHEDFGVNSLSACSLTSRYLTDNTSNSSTAGRRRGELQMAIVVVHTEWVIIFLTQITPVCQHMRALEASNRCSGRSHNSLSSIYIRPPLDTETKFDIERRILWGQSGPNPRSRPQRSEMRSDSLSFAYIVRFTGSKFGTVIHWTGMLISTVDNVPVTKRGGGASMSPIFSGATTREVNGMV